MDNKDWIPVTERLPDDDKFYIVSTYDEGFKFENGKYVSVGFSRQSWYAAYEGKDKGWHHLDGPAGTVTHWQPFPQYKDNPNEN
jgi:hypothetical protein